ncbi:MAG: putative TIM-barrel fold metal-dependent hydrolase [Gammaproteobacteria bacterium]|jgi:predicted TIM-barrel fold metal-dependent hydrolase
MCRVDMPDDDVMVNEVRSWIAADESLRQRVFVDNPAALYDFPSIAN